MRFSSAGTILLFALIGTTLAATNYELEAKKFIDDASVRYFKLYNDIAKETYSSTKDEDFEAIFAKLDNVKKIAAGLVEISEEAKGFDLSKIKDDQIKSAIHNLRMVGNMFVLGESYFSAILVNMVALKELATDRDIEPYLGGAFMPNQDSSEIALVPDVQRIYQRSNDSDELKYYWETWRDKNLLWASINFQTIAEAIHLAAKSLDVPVLEFWYRYYDNKDFLKEMEKVVDEIKPMYKEMHAFVRSELFKKYGSDALTADGPIPDHLFNQVLEQVWQEGSVIENYFAFRDLPPYDNLVKDFNARQLIDEAERFYSSMGFAALPNEFYKNQLKEHDEEGNSGDCSANIFDVTPHVYMEYCQKVDFRKFMQNHGYLSRIHYAIEKKNLPAHYFNSYDLEYPLGEAVILSASSPKHLTAIGLAKDFNFSNKTLMNRLFRMGIHTIFNIPIYFVHTKVMNDLLSGAIEMDGINKHYWRLMENYAGVEPPVNRPEESIDFPYKFYVSIDENYQTKKFVSEVLGYQFYKSFCKKSHQEGQLHNCDFYGNLSIGNDLKAMMALGSSKPWREVIAKVLPENSNLSGDALLEYYAPILDWIKSKNREANIKVGWSRSKKKVI